MSRKFYSLLLLAFFLASAQAQTNTKLDLRLFKRLKSGDIHTQNMPLLVRGNLDEIEKLTEHFGGTYKYGYNRISSIDIPEKNLIAFSESKAVEKIESTGGKGTFLMDTARIRNNIDSIHAGALPLPHDLKGRNVVLGIIDLGIDWHHLDFKNPADNTTRIKYIWDQKDTTGSHPSPYNYGTQWTAAQINNNSCTFVPDIGDAGHGTCVAGIAGGNGYSNVGTPYEGQFVGVAPETDIIAVNIGDDYSTKVPDAVDYIFKKADSLGKPCVINTSIGDYYGSHDGLDLTAQMIDALINAKNGRVLVAAAGNAGQIPYHLGYSLTSDTAYTWFTYNPNIPAVYFDWWADVADFQNAYFAIGCNSSTGTNLGSTPFYNVPVNFNPPQGSGTYDSYTLPGLGLVEMYASLDGTRYNVEVFITPNSGTTSNIWRLQMKGAGTFDLWSHQALLGNSNMLDNLNSVYITDPKYRHPDYLKNMVSSWQNSDEVITVGNYSNRASYVDYNGNVVNLLQSPYWETVGQRFGTSSQGPTRDNRVKPDVMATGSTTICTGDAAYVASLVALNSFKISVTHVDVRNGGTSMASPIVAGIAALYLEKYPHASHNEIKQALICTAKSDGFTGVTPNPGYGYGKVDGFAAIAHSCIVYGSHDTACANYNLASNTDTGCIAKVYGIMDTACMNYNPLATVNSGVCVPKVYGVMDTACMNYNPLANVSGGVCVPKVYGVMDTACLNYNPNANVSGGVCVPKVYGVMDTACMNYNPNANVSGGVCVPKVYGIMDTSCLNYNPNANVSGGVCVPKVYGITDTSCINYNPNANVNNGVCTPKVYGIMDTACMNYNANANVSGGVCVPKVYGIMDTSCINYNPNANMSGGVCVAKVYGIMDTACMNYNANANVSGGVCVPKVYGIMDTSCINYNPNANVSGGNCTAKIYGVMDTACINYNPAANVGGGSCVAKVYGPADSTCANYNPNANVNGSCISSISPVNPDLVSIQVIPNPFSSQTTFILDGLQFEKGIIKIYDQLGQLVDEINLTPGKTQYIYRNDKLAKAVYNYLLQADNRNIKAGKLVVE